MVEVDRAVQLQHDVSVGHGKEDRPRRGLRRSPRRRERREPVLRQTAGQGVSSRPVRCSCAIRLPGRRARWRPRPLLPPRSGAGRSRREARAAWRSAPSLRNQDRSLTSSSARSRSASVSQRRTSVPQLPKRGFTTTGNCDSRGLVGSEDVGGGRVGEAGLAQAGDGEQLVVRGEQGVDAVQDSDPASAKLAEDLDPGLDPVHGRKDVQTAHRRVSGPEPLEGDVRIDEEGLDTERAPRGGDGLVRRLRPAEDADDRRSSARVGACPGSHASASYPCGSSEMSAPRFVRGLRATPASSAASATALATAGATSRLKTLGMM